MYPGVPNMQINADALQKSNIAANSANSLAHANNGCGVRPANAGLRQAVADVPNPKFTSNSSNTATEKVESIKVTKSSICNFAKEEKPGTKIIEPVKIEFHDDREHLNIVFIGHVDAGKSTLSGQILILTGQADERTVTKYKEIAKQKNRDS